MTNGVTGWVVRGSTSDAWVSPLTRLLTEPALRARMSAEARAYACGRRWESALEPLYRTYQHVLLAHQRGVGGLLTMPGGSPA